jgi:hypothetical protein
MKPSGGGGLSVIPNERVSVVTDRSERSVARRQVLRHRSGDLTGGGIPTGRRRGCGPGISPALRRWNPRRPRTRPRFWESTGPQAVESPPGPYRPRFGESTGPQAVESPPGRTASRFGESTGPEAVESPDRCGNAGSCASGYVRFRAGLPCRGPAITRGTSLVGRLGAGDKRRATWGGRQTAGDVGRATNGGRRGAGKGGGGSAGSRASG